MPLASSRLIVHERAGEWAVACKRLLRGSGVVVCQTRTATQCRQELTASPASVVALELTADNLSTVLTLLVAYARSYPQARFLVLATRGDEPCEALLREAGAVQVVFSAARLASAIGLVRRHVAQAPPPERTIRETIWSRLPWGGSVASA